MFKNVLIPPANAFLFVKKSLAIFKIFFRNLTVVLLLFLFVCWTNGCNLILRATSEFSYSSWPFFSLFIFDNLKFVSQERNELQPKTDYMLGFLFCLVYNLYFPSFFSVWPLAFTFKKTSFGGNLWSNFDPWDREQKELPSLRSLTSHTRRIIFSIFFFFFLPNMVVHCRVLSSLPDRQLLNNVCSALKQY